MFKFNSNHRLMKWVTLSASAVMMLSIGGGIANVHTQPVHAASVYRLFSRLDSSSQLHLIEAVQDGEITRPMLHRAKAEYESNPQQFNALLSEYHYHISPELLKQVINQDSVSKKPANNSHQKVTVKPGVMKSIKKSRKSHNRIHKSKGHKNAKLLRQIKDVKKEVRQLNRQIKLVKDRKYRARRAKQNAKLQLRKLNRKYKAANAKLNRLSKQVKGTKKISRRRKAIKRHSRKSNKRMKKHASRRAKRTNKKSTHRTVKHGHRK